LEPQKLLRVFAAPPDRPLNLHEIDAWLETLRFVRSEGGTAGP
jgi:hypothetical protein